MDIFFLITEIYPQVFKGKIVLFEIGNVGQSK